MSELQELLNTDEGKAQFQELAKASGFVPQDEVAIKVEETVKGLKNKNSELLAKLDAAKPLKEEKQKISTMLDKHGINDYNTLDELLDRIKNPDDPDEVRKLRQDYSKAEYEAKNLSKTLESATNQLGEAESFIKDILTKEQLKSGCLAQGCTSTQAEAVSSYLLSKAKFEIINDNGIRKAVTEDGSTTEDFFTSWLDSPEAKELMPAKRNVGGGASTNGGGTGQIDIKAELDKAVASGDTLKAIRLSRQLQQ